MEYEIRLATEDDDPTIRELLRRLEMPSDIAISFEREPDYFAGAHLYSFASQVHIAVHTATGKLAGLATRSIRKLYVNGVPMPIGYVSHLRVAKEFQGRWLVSRAMRRFRDLHADALAPIYLANIVDQNAVAKGIMVEKPRKGFPTFRLLGHVNNTALIVGRPARVPPCRAKTRMATAAELPALVDFLNSDGRRRQFFPVVETGWFGSPKLPGLRPEDFVVAVDGDKITGAIGLWDQSAYKQSVVRGYGGKWRWGRPIYNAAAPFLGFPALPPVGERIREAYAALVSVRDDDPAVFRAMLRRMLNAAAEAGHSSVILGLDLRDPLLKAAAAQRHISYRTSLYVVFFEDGQEFADSLDGRIPSVESSSL